MRWDKWGNSYRIKKGRQVVSLSDLKSKSKFKSSNFVVDEVHSTVVDWRNWINFVTPTVKSTSIHLICN